METYRAKRGTTFHHEPESGPDATVGILSNGVAFSAPYGDLRDFVQGAERDATERGRVKATATVAPQFAERRAALPAAKRSVTEAIEAMRDLRDSRPGLTPFERQMFDVAIKAVRGAR